MPNMSLKKNEMPSQDPNVRNKNFMEVALGYTEEQALDEAARCLNCKNHPCVSGCPVQVKIPEFIKKITEKDYEGAYQVIHQTSSLPAVCGRVCPQESQCEMHCVRGKKGDPVGIGRLERFVADWHNAHSTEAPEKPQSNGHKVAVVGSGPAGLTCAGDLAKKGYEVTVYEALHLAGGVLVYGIPEFRLPKSIVQKEVDGLKAMGVKVETNIVVGRTITIDELMEELREQGVTRIEDVKYAVLENSGKAALYQILADFTADCGSLLSIAVGKKCQLFQLSLSYQSALTALKYCRSSENGIAFFDDMTLEILLSSISEQEKNAYLQKTISALSDEEKNLLQTYFEANMSLLGTSQKLFLHKNTVQYKLNHIYQKCRLNPRVFKDAVLLYLALQL